MRRQNAPFYGKRFIGNSNPDHFEVHDLDKENTNCQINEIKHHHIVTFTPDTLEKAEEKGFDRCAWCLGQSKR